MRRCVRTGEIDECDNWRVRDRDNDLLGDIAGDLLSSELLLLPAREKAGEVSLLEGRVHPFGIRSGCAPSSSLKLAAFMQQPMTAKFVAQKRGQPPQPFVLQP